MYDCRFPHTMLDVQYRMSPAISAFPSLHFYDNRIVNGQNVADPEHRRPPLLGGQPYCVLQIVGEENVSLGGSYSNAAEARCVVQLVKQLRDTVSGGRAHWYSGDRIRIITFYHAQVLLIKRLLREENFGDKIVVASVDSSQGCEADVVVVSFVRSQKTTKQISARRGAGFLTDDRRLNVALTRARFQMICVGNLNGMPNSARSLQLLAANAKDRNAVHPFPIVSSNMNTRLDLFYGERAAKKPKLGGSYH